MMNNLVDVSSIKLVCFGVAGTLSFMALYKWHSRRALLDKTFDKESILPMFREMEKWGLDYGSSLADTYFHGYLKIILPPGTVGGTGFVDRVKKYKVDELLMNEEFPNKIFVIVHKNGYSPDSYDKEEPSRFSSRKTMPFVVDGRSGIRKRSYQSSVYKIFRSSMDKTKHITVVMEGAPCLRQLYESALISPALKEMSDTIISTFMDKLREKINEHSDCRGLCELIYFDDSPGSDMTGKGGYQWLANKILELVELDKRKYFS